MTTNGDLPWVSTRADPLLTARALLPVAGEVVTWDATGDTAFELLLHGAPGVRVVVGTPASAALVALKVAAVRTLSPVAVRDFLGAGPIGRRLWFYHSLRGALPASARDWWDRREGLIREGILDGGRWERHLARFRTHVLPRIHSQADIGALLAPTDAEEGRTFVTSRWRTVRWRAAVSAWFAGSLRGPAPGMGGSGRATEARVHAAMLATPPGDSPPLVWWLTGRWSGGRGTPRWLTDPSAAALRDRLDALTLVGPDAAGEADAVDLGEAWDQGPEALRPALLASVRPGGHLLLRTAAVPPAGAIPLADEPIDPYPFAPRPFLLRPR